MLQPGLHTTKSMPRSRQQRGPRDLMRKGRKLDLEARERQAWAQASEEREESQSHNTRAGDCHAFEKRVPVSWEAQQRVVQEPIRQDGEQRLRGKKRKY